MKTKNYYVWIGYFFIAILNFFAYQAHHDEQKKYEWTDQRIEKEILKFEVVQKDFEKFVYEGSEYTSFVDYGPMGDGGIFFYRNGDQISVKEYLRIFFLAKGKVIDTYPSRSVKIFIFSDEKTIGKYVVDHEEVQFRIYTKIGKRGEFSPLIGWKIMKWKKGVQY